MCSYHTHFLLGILISIVVSSCCMDYFERVSIVLTNNSDIDIWVSHNSPNLIGPPSFYEDRVYYNKTEYFFVKRHASSFIFDTSTKNGWEWIKKKEYPEGLHFQVWDNELIQQLGWEAFLGNSEIQNQYKLEFEIDLSFFINNGKEEYMITYPLNNSAGYLRIIYPKEGSGDSH